MTGESELSLPYKDPHFQRTYVVKTDVFGAVLGRFYTWEDAWHHADSGEVILSEETQSCQRKP